MFVKVNVYFMFLYFVVYRPGQIKNQPDSLLYVQFNRDVFEVRIDFID